MMIGEGENRSNQLAPKEFIRAIRILYARTPYGAISPGENLTPEEIDEEDAVVERRTRGEYGVQLRVKLQEILNATPYLSPYLRVFVEKSLDADFDLGIPVKTETQPRPEHHKFLYDIVTYDLPLVEELESDEETLKRLEISCYRVALAHHVADKEAFDERTKKRIPSPLAYFIQWYDKIVEDHEGNLGKWKSYILEKFEENPDEPTQASQ